MINARGKGGKSITNIPPLGYVFDENDIDNWIVDSRAAKIIRKIFKDFAKGKTITNICRSLNANKVLSPTAYKQKYVFKVHKNDFPEQESNWVPSSVLGILDNPVYIGKIVNFETYSTSFKNKKRLVNPVENRLIFDNHHEPIIDMELWETVQQLRQGRRKSCKRHDEAPLFNGFAYCADCGARMRSCRLDNGSDFYRCSSYVSGGRKQCSSHYITTDTLKELVTDKLRETLAFAKDFEDEFAEIANKTSESLFQSDKKSLSKTISEAQKRLKTLDKLLSALYEDKVAGEITPDTFNRLSQNYIGEQGEIEEKIKSLSKEIKSLDNKKSDISAFLKTVKSYTEITELTPEILAEFIDRILVHAAEKVNSKRTVKVDIYFKGVGNIQV